MSSCPFAARHAQQRDDAALLVQVTMSCYLSVSHSLVYVVMGVMRWCERVLVRWNGTRRRRVKLNVKRSEKGHNSARLPRDDGGACPRGGLGCLRAPPLRTERIFRWSTRVIGTETEIYIVTRDVGPVCSSTAEARRPRGGGKQKEGTKTQADLIAIAAHQFSPSPPPMPAERDGGF